MNDTLKYRKGEVIVFTSGCYSDYSLTAFVVAIEDIDLRSKAAEWLALDPKRARWSSNDSFPSWLIATGLAMPVSYNIAHLGDYEFMLDD